MKPSVLAFLLLGAVALADHALQDSAEKTHYQTLAEGNIVQQLLSVEGTPVEQEPPGRFSFKFLTPNEYFGHLFERCVDPDGALISVGTFRGLSNASSGKFSHLVLLDYSKGIWLFNLIHLQLIRLSRDRYEYLSLLLTGQLNKDLIDRARKGDISFVQFAQTLSKEIPEQAISAHGGTGWIGTRWRALGVQLPSPADWEFVNRQKKGDGNSSIEYYLSKIVEDVVSQTENSQTIGQTFYGDDKRFAALRKMVLERRVTVVQSDLGVAKGLKSAVNTLKNHDIPVSGIDVSNVPVDVWAKGLETLPKGAYRNIFMTVHSYATVTKTTPTTDGWSYYCLTPRQIDLVKKAGAPPERFLEQNFPPHPLNDRGSTQLRWRPKPQ